MSFQHGDRIAAGSYHAARDVLAGGCLPGRAGLEVLSHPTSAGEPPHQQLRLTEISAEWRSPPSGWVRSSLARVGCAALELPYLPEQSNTWETGGGANSVRVRRQVSVSGRLEELGPV